VRVIGSKDDHRPDSKADCLESARTLTTRFVNKDT
jgi:hypothetical protein